MNAATLVTTDTNPHAERIADYMATHPTSYRDYVNGVEAPGTPYRGYNEFEHSGGFYHWASMLTGYNGDLNYIPEMAKAILEEAYWENEHRSAPEPDPIEAEIRQAFPGAIPDDKLAKLRALITERNALQAQANAPITPRDPRLMEHWAKVAKAATAEGYCSEYDRMSEAGDFPTRTELKEAGYLEAPTGTAYGYVTVTISRQVRVGIPFEDMSGNSWGDAHETFLNNEDWDDALDGEIPFGWDIDEVGNYDFSTYEMD